MIVIDLMGDEDVIVIGPEKDPKEEARLEEQRKRVLEEIFRRAPQPALEIVPVDPGR
jgi:hypothetical protein